MTVLGPQVTFSCSNGGSVLMRGEADLSAFGITNDGFAFYNDVALNPEVPVSLTVGGPNNQVTATIQHITGNEVISFELVSQQSNGYSDIRVIGLQPAAWYRLEFNDILAETRTGWAHGRTGPDGILQFNGVKLPNE